MRSPAIDKPAGQRDLLTLLLIRHFELALLELFAAGQLNGTTHTCLGQEYVPVAVSGLLEPEDFVLSNHRGHGHYLARFPDDADGLLAEIMGREGALCSGVGGSQHLRRPGYLSTGVQGESLPVAAGIALHLKRAKPGALACVYIGDGTWGEGAVYEALNMAALWRLPLLVVVEHNGIAQSTPVRLAMAGTVEGRARAFGLPHLGLSTMDVGEIRETLAPLVSLARGGTPVVAEFVTNRLGPHSKGDDTRSAAELQRARKLDWYAGLHGDEFERADLAQRQRVQELVAEVMARPPVKWVAG
jgi:TPP-dependent pyruvate/acetoin dehydrogenase alpha subunit